MIQFRFRKKTASGQNRIKRTDGVAFAEDQPIPIWIGRVASLHSKFGPIKRHQQIHAGKGAREVSALGPVG